jgi:hypothetical protein
MGEKKTASKISVRQPEGTHHLSDIGIDRRIILKLIIKKMGERMWTGFI